MVQLAIIVLLTFCSFGVLSKEMRACVDEFPPYQSLQPEPHGDNIIALRLLGKLIQHQTVFIPSPNFARCLRMLDTGNADIVAGVIDSEDRAERWLLLPYRHDARYVFLYRPGTAPVTQYQDLVGHRIAVSRNTLYFSRFDEDTTLTKEVVGDLVTGVKMLLADRVSLVIVPENALPSLASQFEDFNARVLVSGFGHQEPRIIHFAISPRHGLSVSEDELANIIRSAFEQSLFERAILAAGENSP